MTFISRWRELPRQVSPPPQSFVTMLLGGLWHGAGWTFICWGALHGFYLAINHGWEALLEKNTPLSRSKPVL